MKIFTLLFSLELVCGLDVFFLNNDQAEHEGYLSYYTGGRWNFLCTAFWDNRNSKVVCRQLGFSKVSANQTRFDLNKAEDTGVWEKYLHCEGHEESLDECRRENIKWNVYKRMCSNVEHRVFLRCSKQRDDDILTSTSKGQTLRLWDSSGKLVSSGVLQHMEDGRWKNVCAVGWDEANSHVACSVLGYTTSISCHTEVPGKEVTEELTSAAYFRCKGFETSLWECEKATAESCQGAVKLNCVTKHPKKVGKDVRLRGSTLPGEGRVEVWNRRAWGTVCDDAWDLKDAHVVCKQLGYGSAREATHWATQGQGLGPIVFTETACLGNETSLLECTRKADGNDCTHAEDAGVKCHIPKLLHQDVRLVGGKKLSEGRIEVSFDSGVNWGSICGIGFTETEGQIVCKQLGYGYAKWADRSYKYGVLYRKLMYNVRCNGSETSIKDCHYNTHGRCRYYDMASVICSQHAPDLVMDMSTFRDSIKVESHALRELRCSFEENCLAPVVDRMFFYRNRWSKRHLLKFTSRFMNKGSADFRPNQHKDSWEWHSCHKHYHSMETFAVYDIIDKDARAVAEGHKASFCLEDSECEQGFNKMYNCTNKGDQGVSVNCADNYKNTIDCQWIDITDLKEGNYSLRVVVNPSRGIIETDYHNNHATCQLSYHANRTVSVHECATEVCTQESFGGTGFGHCCHFPFTYKNELYYECIHTTDRKGAWCGTTFNTDVDEKWGFCNMHD